MYDTETNTWSEKSPIPTLRNNPAIVAKDSLIYVIGGAGSEKVFGQQLPQLNAIIQKRMNGLLKLICPLYYLNRVR